MGFPVSNGICRAPHIVRCGTANAGMNGLAAGNDADADVLLNRMSGLHSSEERTVRQFIVNLKRDLGIANMADMFDAFYLFAQPVQANALLNWAQAAYDCVTIGAVNFGANLGFIGTASNGMNSLFNPVVANANFQQNSHSMGVYMRTRPTSIVSQTQIGMSATGSGYSISIGNTDATNFQVRSATVGSNNFSNNGMTGLFAMRRQNSAFFTRFKNGTTFDKTAQASASPGGGSPFYITCLNAVGTLAQVSIGAQISAAYWGSGDIDNVVVYKRIQEYLYMTGAAV